MQRFCEDVEPHEHEQGFCAALEARYLSGMCEQLVRVFDEIGLEKGIILQSADYKLPRVDEQARGRTTPQMIPEYVNVCSDSVAALPSIDAKRCLREPCKHVPAGSCLLRTEKRGNMLLCVFEIFIHVKRLWTEPRPCGTLRHSCAYA